MAATRAGALPDVDPAWGIAIPQPYEDRGELGRGGMGLVHGAWDPALERHVAVKVVRPSLAATGVLELRDDVTRFVRGDERTPTRRFEPGEKVLVEGEESAAAYVVVAGRCAVYQDRDGRRVDPPP